MTIIKGLKAMNDITRRDLVSCDLRFKTSGRVEACLTMQVQIGRTTYDDAS